MNRIADSQNSKETAKNKAVFDIRPKNLSRWLNELPRANHGETAKQIYNLLQETNQATYSYKKRLEFLESLREHVSHITESTKKHYIGINLPLPDKNQQIANITKKLFFNMAEGYKIALADAVESKSFLFDTKPIAMLIQRSISYLNKSILTSYQSYSQFPSQYWQDLHKLYRYAEKKGILNDSIIDTTSKANDETTINNEYSKIILLSLASPSHLQHGESESIYIALEHWLSVPIISPLNEQNKKTDQFVINLAKATRPSSLSFILAQGKYKQDYLRIINTKSILDKLTSKLNEQKSENHNITINMRNHLSQDLMQRLLLAWNINTKRQYPRANRDEQVKVTIGLNSVHQFISQKNKKSAEKFEHQSQYVSVDVSQKIAVPVDDVWAVQFTPEPTQLSHGDTIVRSKMELPEYHTDDWLILNESTTGLSINNRDELNNKVQVGELISLSREEEGKSKKWNVGVIRWLRFNSDESLQMGIEILNPNSAAIGIQKSNVALQRALMLPEIRKLQQPACILASPSIWNSGDEIIVNMQGKEISAVLTNPIQNTRLFSQYQFEITGNKAINQSNSVSQTKATDSDVWSLI